MQYSEILDQLALRITPRDDAFNVFNEYVQEKRLSVSFEDAKKITETLVNFQSKDLELINAVKNSI